MLEICRKEVLMKLICKSTGCIYPDGDGGTATITVKSIEGYGGEKNLLVVGAFMRPLFY